MVVAPDLWVLCRALLAPWAQVRTQAVSPRPPQAQVRGLKLGEQGLLAGCAASDKAEQQAAFLAGDTAPLLGLWWGEDLGQPCSLLGSALMFCWPGGVEGTNPTSCPWPGCSLGRAQAGAPGVCLSSVLPS